MLEARHARICLKGRLIVEDVDLSIESGEMVGILGPNGAGKSTLLKALAGLIPCEGIVLESCPLESVSISERSRRLAYLPQNASSHWPMSVRDVVALGRMPHQKRHDRPSLRDQAIIDRAMQEADIATLADRSFLSLSGGERARVLLARALAVEAPLLLADEPVAHLDPGQQLRIMDVLRRRVGQGDAVVIALHDLNLALAFCNRVILIHDGKIQASGPPERVLNDALLCKTFGIAVTRGVEDGHSYLLPRRWVG